MQASDVIHLGVDNLDVVRQVGRLLDGVRSSRLAELVNEGDILMLIGKIFELRRKDTVRVTKVKEHADEGNGSGWAGTRVGQAVKNAVDEAS